MSKRRHAGCVVDGAGAPVAGAFVTVVASTAPVPEIALVTDDEGRFSIGLPEGGRFRLRADTRDARAGEVDVASPRESAQAIVIRVG